MASIQAILIVCLIGGLAAMLYGILKLNGRDANGAIDFVCGLAVACVALWALS